MAPRDVQPIAEPTTAEFTPKPSGADSALAEAMRAACAPIETARPLPNAVYVDPSHHSFETTALFHGGWAGLGFAHEVREPGDAKPIDHLGAPLLMLRDKQGRIRVFENVCRHRGMILVDAPRKIEGAIRCPYHSWCYGLDGRLAATPHVGGPGQNLHPAIERSELGLVELPSAEYLGVVFVNVDRKAAPFEEVFAPLMARWAEFQKSLSFGGAESEFNIEIAANWKLAVENYCESYHLPWVHPGLNAYSRLEDHYNVEEDSYFGQGTLVYRAPLSEDGQSFPTFADLSDKWDSAAEYLVAAPNVLFGVHRDHVFAMLLEPQSVSTTLERVAIFYADESACGDDYAALRRSNAQLWRSVFDEDIAVVEGMQRGRAAPNFDGGAFSPAMDGPTHAFHTWAARRLADALGA